MLSSSENTRRKKCNFRRLFYSVTRDKPFVLWYIPASRFRAPAQPAEKPSPRRCSSQPSTSWKDGRVVDCTALERRHTEIPYRGFESLSFRQDFLYRRRFKAALLHGHKIGHQKPKKPPIWIVLVRGFCQFEICKCAPVSGGLALRFARSFSLFERASAKSLVCPKTCIFRVRFGT